MDVDERGQSGVTNEIVKMINEAWAEATEKAKRDKEQIATAMLRDGMSPDKVAQLTGLSIRAVNQLKASSGISKKSA